MLNWKVIVLSPWLRILEWLLTAKARVPAMPLRP